MAITFKDLEKVNKEIKTTPIKGKDYADVTQRIIAFRKLYPEGFIRTEMIENMDGIAVFQAMCGFYREDGTEAILGSGTAFEKETSSFINKTSYIENCETSAVGRALGMAGFGIGASIASYEEVSNAMLNQQAPAQPVQQAQPAKAKQEICVCAKCQNLIRDTAKYPARQIIEESRKRFNGVTYCYNCMREVNEEQKKAQAELPFPLEVN